MLIAFQTFLALSGCTLFKKPDTLYYRITVEVETPNGLKYGTGIREVTSRDTGCMGPELISNAEAIPIEIAPHETIFALVHKQGQWETSGPSAILGYALLNPEIAPSKPVKWQSRDMSDNYLSRLSQIDRPHELPRFVESPEGSSKSPLSGWPSFVRFRDMKDVHTIEEINPDDIMDGYYVKRISIQISKDRPKFDLEKRYPNLKFSSLNNKGIWMANEFEPSSFVFMGIK